MKKRPTDKDNIIGETIVTCQEGDDDVVLGTAWGGSLDIYISLLVLFKKLVCLLNITSAI